METDSSLPFEDFLTYIENAFTDANELSYQESKFHNRLRDEAPSLLAPLSFPAPNASEQTTGGNETSAAFQQNVQQMSSQNNLSRKECEKWLKIAMNYDSDNTEDKAQLAISLLLNERVCLLLAFLELARGRYARNLREELKQIIQRFLEELRQQRSPIVALLAQLKEFLGSNRFVDPAFAEMRQRLCWLVVECVFYLVYSPSQDACEVAQEEVAAILEHLKWLCQMHHQADDSRKPELYQLMTGLLLAFLHLSTYHRITDEDSSAIQQSLQQLSKYDAQWSALASLSFAQRRDIHASRDTILNALSQDAWSLISRLLTQPLFRQNEQNQSTFCGVLDDVTCRFIVVVLDELLGDLSLEEVAEVKIRLFQVLADLHELEPTLALKFWDEEESDWGTFSRLNAFIRTPFGNSFPAHSVCFNSYLRLLTASARVERGAQYVYQHLHSSTTIINWTHFLDGIHRFRQNFRQAQQELRSGQSNRMAAVNMPEEEMGHLVAILQLVQQVCLSSAQVRMKIADNPKWDMLTVLFEFVSCSLPIRLKGAIMECLAALAHSPTIAQRIWPFLEMQHTYSRSRTSSGEKFVSMVEKELANVESKQQNYAYTLAFLHLLQQLLQPVFFSMVDVTSYLEYTRRVFLTFADRNYEDEVQMWQVAALCLDIYQSILKNSPLLPLVSGTAPPTPSSFHHTATTPDAANPHDAVYRHRLTDPVHTPALQLFTDFTHSRTESIFNTILRVLHIGKETLETDRMTKRYGEWFEKAVLRSLLILENVLEQEDNFRDYFPDRMLTVPSYHLLHVEHGDFIVALTRLIGYEHNSAVSLHIIRLLILLSHCKSNRGVSHLDRLTHILSRPECMIRQQLVRLLSQANTSETDTQIKEAICHLLLKNTKGSAPTLTHFLLDFGTETRRMRRVDLSASPASCLRVILNSLYGSYSFPVNEAHLCEMYYHVLYELSANKYTYEALLAFLRRFENFYSIQLATLPSIESPSLAAYGRAPATSANLQILEQWDTKAHLLLQRSWLLKVLALELHVNAVERRRPSHRLLDELLQVNDSFSSAGGLQGNEQQNDVFHSFSRTRRAPQKPSRMKIIELLDDIMVPLPKAPQVALPFEDLDLAHFQRFSAEGLPLFDMDLLKEVLSERMSRLQRENMTSAENLAKYREAINQTLEMAAEQNVFSALFSAKLQLFDAWKQIVEVMLLRYFDSVPQQCLYDLLEVLLHYYSGGATEGHVFFSRDLMGEAISGSVLTLMCKLHQMFHLGRTHDSGGHDLPVTKFHGILRGFLAGVFSYGTTQTMRGNLFVGLLYFLRLTRFQLDQLPLETQQASKMWWIASEMASSQKLIHGNVEILERFGEKLIELICKDASGSAEVWKSTCFALLDVLMSYDRKYHWLQFLEQRGFLRHFIDDLVQQDESLQRALTSFDLLRLIYVYESKMSLFTHMAQSVTGAQKLVAGDIVLTLTRCQFMDQWPEVPLHGETQSWFPTFVERYHQLLIPVLELLAGLLTTLPHDTTLAAQVLHLIQAHSELFSILLRDKQPTATLHSLKELRLVTLIFYRVSKHRELYQEKLHGLALKFQNLLVQLVAKYFRAEDAARKDTFVEFPEDQAAAAYEISSICQNLAAYCYSVSSSDIPTLLFSFTPAESKNDSMLSSRSHSPPVRILVEFLRESIQKLNAAHKLVNEEQEKLKNVNGLSLDDMRQLDPAFAAQMALEEHEHSEQQKMAQLHLQSMIADSYSRISILEYTIENVLSILWRQLEFVMAHAGPLRPSLKSTDRQAGQSLDAKDVQNFKSSSEARTLLSILPNISRAPEGEADLVGMLCQKLEQLLQV